MSQRESSGAGCRQQPQPGRKVACVNNCGFFGDEATFNMCPNCRRSVLSSHAEAAPSLDASTSTSTSLDSTLHPETAPLAAHASGSHDSPPLDNLDTEASAAEDDLLPDLSNDVDLLDRVSSVESPVRAMFPRVQSASESACWSPQSGIDAAAAAAAAVAVSPIGSRGGPRASIEDATNLGKVDTPADSLVRTNASRTVDVDMLCKATFASPLPPVSVSVPSSRPPVVSGAHSRPAVAAGAASKPNRCDVCRKKVGLTGFKCRCKGLFCGFHRYSDKHTCSFDYKSVGRDAIAKANPIVKADKVVRF